VQGIESVREGGAVGQGREKPSSRKGRIRNPKGQATATAEFCFRQIGNLPEARG